MENSIKKITLKANNTTVNALAFIPGNNTKTDRFAIFCHGYTSHKGSILTWASKMYEEGIAAIIFDQPGHFLGSFNEVASFEDFKQDAPLLYLKAYEYLKTIYPDGGQKIAIGGHSLGALTSLIALEREYFKNLDCICVCVGFGLPPSGIVHVFDTPFYKSTLHLRGELVSEKIPPSVVFAWIKERKEELVIVQHRIHFITGEDDAVVGKDGTERLAKFLEDQGNIVSVEKPSKLSHHMPELAAPHIKKFLKDQDFLK